MQITVHPSKISGIIQAPASKSSMQRACAAALLHKGSTVIINPGISNDDQAAIDVIKQLGATVSLDENSLLITNTGYPTNAVDADYIVTINCGESGLGIRMFAPIAAIGVQQIIITGSGSLLSRPMNFFDEIFPQLSIHIKSQDGKLPITLKGPLQPVDITVDGSLSSQFLTGLLFAFAKVAVTEVKITVINLKSKPYIDLTLQVMKHFGYIISNQDYKVFTIHPKLNQASKQIEYIVEGDWSGAAFLLVAGAISGEITVKGLDVFSTQADKAILQAISMSQAVLSVEEKQIVVAPGNLKAFHFNATDCPDLFPPLVALAAYCNGTTVIEGVSRLAHKESNRGLTLQEEFGKMGVTITIQDDLMLIEGGRGVIGANVESHHDHRIAMACAVAGLNASGITIINDADAINKSYPNFYAHLIQLGSLVSLPINH